MACPIGRVLGGHGPGAAGLVVAAQLGGPVDGGLVGQVERGPHVTLGEVDDDLGHLGVLAQVQDQPRAGLQAAPAGREVGVGGPRRLGVPVHGQGGQVVALVPVALGVEGGDAQDRKGAVVARGRGGGGLAALLVLTLGSLRRGVVRVLPGAGARGAVGPVPGRNVGGVGVDRIVGWR